MANYLGNRVGGPLLRSVISQAFLSMRGQRFAFELPEHPEHPKV